MEEIQQQVNRPRDIYFLTNNWNVFCDLDDEVIWLTNPATHATLFRTLGRRVYGGGGDATYDPALWDF